ncbi:MAG TPA: GAF domain-containing sensor histidine kinase [Humisphaera sp.]|jgi:signal transduction histidine kinase|nr:GAF domain-containing sensor histidine kinase [Humisphaera sp.]
MGADLLQRADSLTAQRRPPEWVAATAGVAMLALMAWWRIGWAGRFSLPIGYGLMVVLIALFRSRRVLWGSAIGYSALTIYKFFVLHPSTAPTAPFSVNGYDAGAGVLVLVDLWLVTGVAHLWIKTREGLARQNVQLVGVNTDLSIREEEIARQNEELQSQTEELERQSEELRLSNDELAAREKTLQSLLSLSRSLAMETTRDAALSRICQTLGDLLDGQKIGSAVLEFREDQLHVRCHHGFGPEGLAAEAIPKSRSFAALVIARDHTGYLDDITRRPDLELPQPKNGEQFVAVLATPLRVAGKPVGTLEVYATRPMVWTDDQIGLIESLAAQTSISIESAEMFETISRERQRFETVLRTIPFGVAVANAQCTDIRFNPAGAAILGVPPEENIAPELRRRAWAVFQQGQPLPPEQAPIMRACIEGREILAQEVEVVLRGTQRISLLVNARPILNAQGVVMGAVSAFIDISAQKDLQRELDARRREAEEASVRKTHFLAAVSHDIRTPANAISLLAELTRRTAANPAMVNEVPQLAAELHASALALVNLLSDVLDVARFDAGRIELQESEFDLVDLLQDEVRQMGPLAREKGLELICQTPSQKLRLRADRIKLARVLGNLIGNSIKFTDQGSIRLEASPSTDGGMEIRVIDTGIGIAPEHQRHIFDEFFQLRNPERDRNKGTGLGLTICKRLVDAMGGQIIVESQIGKGSKFTISLPATSVAPV